MAAKWGELIAKSQHLSEEKKQFLLKNIRTGRQIYLLLFHSQSISKKMLNKTQLNLCKRFIEKIIHQTVKNAPRVQKIRSFLAEPETYRIFEKNGTQYIAIMSIIPGERIVIPLTGNTKISGEIRVVFDFERQRIEIHHFVEFKVKIKKNTRKRIGIDLGITEVFTDSDGSRYGIQFGNTLFKISEQRKEKGKKRNKLTALEKKYNKAGNIKKARKIKKHNLGTKK